MARGRMLSQSIAEDIEFNEMSMEAQLMYVRAIPFLDRDGLVNGHPSILFGKIAPLLPDILPKMKTIIDEWSASGLIISYVDGKTTVLYFKGFTQNQIGMRYDREPESQFSPPPGYARSKTGLTKDAGQIAGRLPEVCRQSAGSLPPEEKRREENKREENNGVAVVVGGDFSETTADSVVELWKENMPGSFTPIVENEISGLIDTYTAAEVDTAIRLAVKANKRTIPYVSGILKRRSGGGDRDKAPRAAPVTGNVSIGLATI